MKKLFLICFFSLQIIANAQLKVGNNPKTISSNTYFDLESTNGNRFVISKDSAKVGIGTTSPTNLLFEVALILFWDELVKKFQLK